MGAVAAALGSSSRQADLRSGVTPWAFCAVVVGIALIVLGSLRSGVGRPRWLLRWGSGLTLAGLGTAATFLLGTGVLAALDSDVLSDGDTVASAAGTLVASVCTLVVLPIGLVALGMAVLRDPVLPGVARALPLAGTVVFLLGPVLVAGVPESGERTVLAVWPLVLGTVWAAYGLLLTPRASRADLRAGR